MSGWLTLRLDWTRSAALTCRLCGRPLGRRAWSDDPDGGGELFCEPDCEALYREYWLPRYGDAARAES